MCGRYTHLYTWGEIHDCLNFLNEPVVLRPSYNVAPTQSAPVVRVDASGRRLDLLKWGLVPSGAKDAKIGYSLINARADTLASKPSIRQAFKTRRCIVPASGFFEWKKVGTGKKHPFYIRSKSDEPFFFAGLWEKSKPQGDEVIESFTIVTTTPNELVAQLHDRMPVILDRAGIDTWLDPKASTKNLMAILKPYPAELMKFHAVSPAMNTARYNMPDCVVPVEEPEG